jgi:hypothetical protein
MIATKKPPPPKPKSAQQIEVNVHNIDEVIETERQLNNGPPVHYLDDIFLNLSEEQAQEIVEEKPEIIEEPPVMFQLVEQQTTEEM